MAAAFNHMQDEISRAARALDGAREALQPFARRSRIPGHARLAHHAAQPPPRQG